MDDNEDDGRYLSNPYDVGHQTGYSSSKHQKVTIKNIPCSRPIENQYVDDYEEGEDDEDLGEEEGNRNENNGVPYVGKDMDDDIVNDEDDYEEGEDDEDLRKEEGNRNENNGVPYVGKDMDDDIVDDEDDYEEGEYEEDLGQEVGNRNENNGVPYVGKDKDDDIVDDEDDNEDEDDYNENADQHEGYDPKNDDVDFKRHPKKRKLKSLLPSYEFAPPVSAPSLWTERETFVLLDACVDILLRRGRKNLRFNEWEEVAEKVSGVTKIERTGTQCRNRLRTLKNKHKDKGMLAESGVTSRKWIYFEKMEIIMSSPPQQGGLSCGLDSGEYAFKNCDNGFDEMRDSLAYSESNDKEDDSDGLPSKKGKFKRGYDEGSSFGLIADMIQKFSNIYETTEKNKMQQMSELQKTRVDFHRELLKQKQQIVDQAHAEIAKIHQQSDDDENEIAKIHQQTDDDENKIAKIHQQADDDENEIAKIHQQTDDDENKIAKIHQQAYDDKNEIAKIHQQADYDKHASG